MRARSTALLALLAAAPRPCATAAGAAGAGRVLFRTWPYENPAANESVSFRAVDLASRAITTLVTLPPADAQAALYVGGGALDASAGLWYSSTCAGDDFGSTAVLTAFDVRAGAVSAELVGTTPYCAYLFFTRSGRLLCQTAAPWYWPPGEAPSNDDTAGLVLSLLEITDASTGAWTFLTNFTPGFVQSFGAPAYDAAADALYLHVAEGLSSTVQVWTVRVEPPGGGPPRVVAVAAQTPEAAIETMVVAPAAAPPAAARLLALAFTAPPSPLKYSLGLYVANATGPTLALAPVGGPPTLYPAVSSSTGAAALSADGATLYVVAVDDKRASWLLAVDTASGALAAPSLPLSAAVCPDDPSPCVVADLLFLAD